MKRQKVRQSSSSHGPPTAAPAAPQQIPTTVDQQARRYTRRGRRDHTASAARSTLTARVAAHDQEGRAGCQPEARSRPAGPPAVAEPSTQYRVGTGGRSCPAGPPSARAALLPEHRADTPQGSPRPTARKQDQAGQCPDNGQGVKASQPSASQAARPCRQPGCRPGSSPCPARGPSANPAAPGADTTTPGPGRRTDRAQPIQFPAWCRKSCVALGKTRTGRDSRTGRTTSPASKATEQPQAPASRRRTEVPPAASRQPGESPRRARLRMPSWTMKAPAGAVNGPAADHHAESVAAHQGHGEEIPGPEDVAGRVLAPTVPDQAQRQQQQRSHRGGGPAHVGEHRPAVRAGGCFPENPRTAIQTVRSRTGSSRPRRSSKRTHPAMSSAGGPADPEGRTPAAQGPPQPTAIQSSPGSPATGPGAGRGGGALPRKA